MVAPAAVGPPKRARVAEPAEEKMDETDPNRVAGEGGASLDRDAVMQARRLAAEEGLDLDSERPGWNSDPARLAAVVAELMEKTRRRRRAAPPPDPSLLERAHALAEKAEIPLPDDWAANRETTETVVETADRALGVGKADPKEPPTEKSGGPRPEGRTPGR